MHIGFGERAGVLRRAEWMHCHRYTGLVKNESPLLRANGPRTIARTPRAELSGLEASGQERSGGPLAPNNFDVLLIAGLE
ncbi:unnamed protein product, partial [Iphiclides podalirius]